MTNTKNIILHLIVLMCTKKAHETRRHVFGFTSETVWTFRELMWLTIEIAPVFNY